MKACISFQEHHIHHRICDRNRWSNMPHYHPPDPTYTDIQILVYIGYNKIHAIHSPWTLHNPNERLNRRSRHIYPAREHKHSLYPTGPTLHYHITRYPMVSHRTPTYFHSSDDTHNHRSELTRIHHADLVATNRTPTIYLLSTRSLVMHIVSSHNLSSLIH